MTLHANRRQFLRTAAAIGIADLGILGQLPSVSADEAKIDPKVVRLDPEIEPLVRLLEETPRDRVLEEVAARIKKGTSYRKCLRHPLAGKRPADRATKRRVQVPCCAVVNWPITSLASPAERWLPIFWALDNFKMPRPRTSSKAWLANAAGQGVERTASPQSRGGPSTMENGTRTRGRRGRRSGPHRRTDK